MYGLKAVPFAGEFSRKLFSPYTNPAVEVTIVGQVRAKAPSFPILALWASKSVPERLSEGREIAGEVARTV
jgi:hypothetical protein